MNDEPKKTLPPKLRFPEFVGQSLQKLHLKDVTAESTVRNGKTLPISSVMGVTKIEGIVPMEERLIASDIARYKLVRKDWFAYNPMRLNIGSIARWKGDSDILVSPDYVVFSCLKESDPGIDPAYLDHFRRTTVWENFVTEGGDGSVRVRIYYEDIARLQLALPTPAEQRKIAACLTSLDELIAAEGRRLEALRAHKKGLMQQLFPRPGESRPRLRFPEFRDDADWVEVTVGDVVDTISPPKKLPTTSYMPEGLYRIVDQSPAQYCGWTDDADAIITPRQPVVVFGDHTCTLKLVTFPFAQGADGIKIIDPLPAVTGDFLFYALSVRPLTSNEYARHYTELKEMVFSLPRRDSGEQQRIAACLSLLDALIAAASRALDGLRAHKKGLMQQLFPLLEGV